VDRFFRTSSNSIANNNIFAIGDCCQTPNNMIKFASIAMDQADYLCNKVMKPIFNCRKNNAKSDDFEALKLGHYDDSTAKLQLIVSVGNDAVMMEGDQAKTGGIFR